jgi:hypothetical protein
VLEDLDIEIVEVPQIPLMRLAERATRRQRPCDAKGDGFRDTLNWLTVMQVATEHPDEEIAWVSNDTDFADEAGLALHPELADELIASGLKGQVVLVRELKQLALMLAETPEERLAEVRKQLQEEALRDFVRQELESQVMHRLVKVHQLGLRIGRASAKIIAMSRLADAEIDINVRGELDGGAGPIDRRRTRSAAP